MFTLEFLGCRVKLRGPQSRRFFFSLFFLCFSLITTREPKRAHFKVPAHTTKIPRKDLQEREERKKNVAGEGKKREILVGPGERPNLGRGVLVWGSCREVLGGAGRSLAQETRHEQQLSEECPIGQGFFWVKDGSQRFGPKTV